MERSFSPKQVSEDLDHVLNEIHSRTGLVKPTQGVLNRDIKSIVKDHVRSGRSSRDMYKLVKEKVIWLVPNTTFITTKGVAGKLLSFSQMTRQGDLVGCDLLNEFSFLGGISLSKTEQICIATTSRKILQTYFDRLIPLLCRNLTRMDYIEVDAYNTSVSFKAYQILSFRTLSYILQQNCGGLHMRGLELSAKQSSLIGSKVSGTLKMKDMVMMESSGPLFSNLKTNKRLKSLTLTHVVVSDCFSDYLQGSRTLRRLTLDHSTLSWLSGRVRLSVGELSVANSFLTSAILDNILCQPNIKKLVLDGCRMLERPQGLSLTGLPSLVHVDLPGTAEDCFLKQQEDWNHCILILQDHPQLSTVTTNVFETGDSPVVQREKMHWALSAMNRHGFCKLLYPRHSLKSMDDLSPILVAMIGARIKEFAEAPAALLPHLLFRGSGKHREPSATVTDLSDQYSMVWTHLPKVLESTDSYALKSQTNLKGREYSRKAIAVSKRRPNAHELFGRWLWIFRFPLFYGLRNRGRS